MRRVVTSAWVVTCALLLISCGGGGGGDGDGGQAVGAPVAITAANQTAVAGTAVGAVTTMIDIGELSTQLIQALSAGLPRAAARGAAALVPGICQTGTLDVTLTETPPVDQINVGDSAVATFSECAVPDEAGLATFNGTITFQVTRVSEASLEFPNPPFDVDLTFTFGNLSTTDDLGTTTIGGGFVLNLATQDGIVLNTEVSGSSLSLAEQSSSGSFTATLTSFLLAIADNQATGAYSIDSNGTVSTTELGGSVTFDTTTPLSGSGDTRPDAGVMLIEGAGGSTLTLTVLDSSFVEMVLDEDGADGATPPSDPETISWDQLEDL